MFIFNKKNKKVSFTSIYIASVVAVMFTGAYPAYVIRDVPLEKVT